MMRLTTALLQSCAGESEGEISSILVSPRGYLITMSAWFANVQRRTYLIPNSRCAALEIERSAISVIADHLTLKSCHGLLRWFRTGGE